MARVTVEDCLDNVDNRFELVMLAARRSRQLRTFGADPLVERENDKLTVVALREIAEGLISHEVIDAQQAAQESAQLEMTIGHGDDERPHIDD